MSECLACKSEGELEFRVLEVQTFYLREMKGERRIQALGRFQDYSICRACATAKLASNRAPERAGFKKVLLFIVLLIAGLIIALSWLKRDRVIGVFGLSAFVCGLLGIISETRSMLEKRRKFRAISGEEAISEAAWDLLLACAPKKSDDSDLTYIPINEQTLKMKSGDLMISFDLLPEIAKQAYQLIHPKD